MNGFVADSALTDDIAPSPNHGERRGGARADMIVLHYTGLFTQAAEAWRADPGGAALAWLRNPLSQVSCHYFVEMDGRIIQLTPEARRAWHAGQASWRGQTDINSCSIGIEIVNLGHDGGLPPYPDRQIASVIGLCRDIADRHGVAPERILGHSDVAPARKADPGEHFPWGRLAAAGVGHWLAPAAADVPGETLREGDRGETVRALRAALAEYGYGLPVSDLYDQTCQRTVRAFQRHFRPSRVDGAADAATQATLRDLIDALPRRAGR